MEFVREGRDFSVADVADAALVGRATAYTYFKTKESLHAQAVLTFVASTDFPSFDDVFERTSGPADRVASQSAATTSIRLHEAQYRALLRSSLDHGGDVLYRAVPPIAGSGSPTRWRRCKARWTGRPSTASSAR